MQTYLYRSGDGNEGNYPRALVSLGDKESPYAAIRALVVNMYIPGCRTRRHIMRNIETDGDADYGINAVVYEGPDGETAFDSAWITAELEPASREDIAHYVAQGLTHYANLRDALDRGAWAYFRKFIAERG